MTQEERPFSLLRSGSFRILVKRINLGFIPLTNAVKLRFKIHVLIPSKYLELLEEGFPPLINQLGVLTDSPQEERARLSNVTQIDIREKSIESRCYPKLVVPAKIANASKHLRVSQIRTRIFGRLLTAAERIPAVANLSTRKIPECTVTELSLTRLPLPDKHYLGDSTKESNVCLYM